MNDKRPGRPPIQKEIRWKEIGDGLYNISCPPVGFQQYLILGSEKALLIDTGMGIGSLRKAVNEITDLPVILVNTHCHPDHAGGNFEFDPALINPADMDVFEQMASLEFRQQDVSHMPFGEEFIPQLLPTGPKPQAAADGQIIDLGGRKLQLIFTPGHTHGSLCVYEEATGTLFTGDNVQGNTTALREWNSTTVETFYESLLKLKKLNVKRILTGHMPNDNPGDLLDRKIACTKQVLEGACDEEREFRGNITCIHEYEGTSVEWIKGNLR